VDDDSIIHLVIWSFVHSLIPRQLESMVAQAERDAMKYNTMPPRHMDPQI